MPGWTQILIVAVLVFLLFGRGKIADVMGDFAKGIKSFKKGMAEDETISPDEAKTIDHDTVSQKVAEKATAETTK